MTTRDVREVRLFLPRFEIAWGPSNVSELLNGLGMKLAFDRSRADFSGINGHAPPDERSLLLSAVVHKAIVEVHEEGTEAAAATAVNMEDTMTLRPIKPPAIPIFRADHPFMFAIRERKSGVILSLGRVDDPTRLSGGGNVLA